MQVTPQGSACSFAFGQGISEMEPGSLNAVMLVVDDADAAKAELDAAGVDATGPEELGWGRFVSLSDPDGNRLTLQELPKG